MSIGVAIYYPNPITSGRWFMYVNANVVLVQKVDRLLRHPYIVPEVRNNR